MGSQEKGSRGLRKRGIERIKNNTADLSHNIGIITLNINDLDTVMRRQILAEWTKQDPTTCLPTKAAFKCDNDVGRTEHEPQRLCYCQIK